MNSFSLSDNEKHLLALLLERKYAPEIIREFSSWRTVKWCPVAYHYQYYCHLCCSFLDVDPYKSHTNDYEKVISHARQHLKESNLLPFL